MRNFKKIALSAAVAGGFALSLGANAAIIDIPPASGNLTVGQFCATTGGEPDTYRTGIYSYTCFVGAPSQTLDPAAAHMTLTDLDPTTSVNIQEFLFSGVATGTLQITGFPTEVLSGSLSYFVELTPPPGNDAADSPDVRFSLIRLTKEALAQNRGNTTARKQITGQNNVIVDDATFTADIAVPGNTLEATATCGVCRKFAVTDTFNNDVNGGSPADAGRIQSLTNTFETVLVVPVPAPLALMAFGLIGLGAFARRRKA